MNVRYLSKFISVDHDLDVSISWRFSGKLEYLSQNPAVEKASSPTCASPPSLHLELPFNEDPMSVAERRGSTFEFKFKFKLSHPLTIWAIKY